jgi:hypothetical protein
LSRSSWHIDPSQLSAKSLNFFTPTFSLFQTGLEIDIAIDKQGRILGPTLPDPLKLLFIKNFLHGMKKNL